MSNRITFVAFPAPLCFFLVFIPSILKFQICGRDHFLPEFDSRLVFLKNYLRPLFHIFRRSIHLSRFELQFKILSGGNDGDASH